MLEIEILKFGAVTDQSY